MYAGGGRGIRCQVSPIHFVPRFGFASCGVVDMRGLAHARQVIGVGHQRLSGEGFVFLPRKNMRMTATESANSRQLNSFQGSGVWYQVSGDGHQEVIETSVRWFQRYENDASLPGHFLELLVKGRYLDAKRLREMKVTGIIG